MRIVYMGTPDFAVPALKRLHAAGHEIPLVISQPDRPAGRGLKVNPTPVKAVATALGLETFQPDRINAPETLERISSLRPDAVVVAAYGRILGKSLLEIPKLGCVNLHASLLPKLRGAAPIQRAVMEALAETGVTTMLMNEKMDEGDILLSRTVLIGKTQTAGELRDVLAEIGAGLAEETLLRLQKGDITPEKQDHALATYAPKIEPSERAINWSDPAEKIDGIIRGLSPHPGAFTRIRGKRVVLLRSSLSGAGGGGIPPGAAVLGPSGNLEVQTGRGRLALLEVRPEGKKAMPGADWARGARLLDERFGAD